MDLAPSEDERLILDSVRAFAAGHASRVPEWDRQDRIPAEVVREAIELGLPGLFLGEAEGGSGFGWAVGLQALEVLAEGSAPLALRAGAHAAALATLAAAGLRGALLAPGFARSLCGATLALEPGRGRAGLEGEARWVPAASDAADVVIRTPRGAVFSVSLDAPGVRREPVEGLGMRGAGLAHVRFEGVGADGPVGHLEPAVVERLAALDRLIVAAIGVGLGRSAVAHGRRYALERRQFGHPIAELQAIQWMLADAATELDATSLLVLRGALALEEGGSGAEPSRAALLLASEAALSAAQKALQIHGGYGFVREFPVERLARDARYLGVALDGKEEGRKSLGRLLLDGA